MCAILGAQLVFFTQPEVAYTPAVLEAWHPDHAVLQALDDILAAYNQEKRLSMEEAGHVFRQVATVTNPRPGLVPSHSSGTDRNPGRPGAHSSYDPAARVLSVTVSQCSCDIHIQGIIMDL